MQNMAVMESLLKMTQSDNSDEDLLDLHKEEENSGLVEEMEEDDTDVASDPYFSVEEDLISSGDEIDSIISEISNPKSEDKPTTEVSSGYASSSDEEKIQSKDYISTTSFEQSDEEIAKYVMSQIAEKYKVDNLPDDLKQMMVVGVTQGLPNDYNPPIDKRPEWLDMKKFKRGQAFARKYFCGVNLSEMASLFVLFGLPDGLETLIFSENSASPFTAFQRYLSTVIRVASWYDHDIWTKGNPGYQNIKTVRAMHLNISKRMESTPFDDLKNQVTLSGSPKKPPIWNTNVREVIQEDLKSGCPFQVDQSKHSTIRRNVFVTQFEMSITQFGFVGLMVTFPEKFGAAGASKEELDAFLHTWRGICYLLGVQDKYNFCNGTLEDVVQRCHSLIDNLIKPNFQNLTKDWEHMSRCLVEGMGYVASTSKPSLSFEVSMMHLFWVLDIPVPRLYSTLSWNQRFEFFMIKFLMTQAVKIPGMLPLMNWLMRRLIAKAASLPADELEKLKNRKFDYEGIKIKEEEDDNVSRNTILRASALVLSVACMLV